MFLFNWFNSRSQEKGKPLAVGGRVLEELVRVMEEKQLRAKAERTKPDAVPVEETFRLVRTEHRKYGGKRHAPVNTQPVEKPAEQPVVKWDYAPELHPAPFWSAGATKPACRYISCA